MALRDRSEAAFDAALSSLGGDPELSGLHAEIERTRAHVRGPMRVAVVGRVSAGKSTLVNAVLGEDLVPTGDLEKTSKVGVVRHIAGADDVQSRAIRIHFRDGRPPELRELGYLEEATSLGAGDAEFRELIDHVEIFLDHERLRLLDIIDTPGLDSRSGESAETERLFADARRDTITHAAGADAVLFVFSRAISQGETDSLKEFLAADAGSFTPINAIGVLTRIEANWEDEDKDPMETGRRSAERNMEHPVLQRLLYRIVPVCTMLARGAGSLDEQRAAALTELSRLAPKDLTRAVQNRRKFREAESGVLPLAPEVRADLFDRMHPWGVFLACELLRDGLDDVDTLRQELERRSGLVELRELVESHFGNRAHLIKLQTALAQSRRALRPASRQLPDAARRPVADALAKLEQLETNEHAFEELRALRDHYEGKLELTEAEAQELERVTGEHGVWVPNRLGLDARASVVEMDERANERLGYWARRATDPSLRRASRDAAAVMRRSYELIVHHVGAARAHLELFE